VSFCGGYSVCRLSQQSDKIRVVSKWLSDDDVIVTLQLKSRAVLRELVSINVDQPTYTRTPMGSPSLGKPTEMLSLEEPLFPGRSDPHKPRVARLSRVAEVAPRTVANNKRGRGTRESSTRHLVN